MTRTPASSAEVRHGRSRGRPWIRCARLPALLASGTLLAISWLTAVPVSAQTTPNLPAASVGRPLDSSTQFYSPPPVGPTAPVPVSRPASWPGGPAATGTNYSAATAPGTAPANSTASGYLPTGYQPSGYQPSGYQPTGNMPPGYTTPGYTAPPYTAPSYAAPGYAPAGYTPPASAAGGYAPAGYAPAGNPASPGYNVPAAAGSTPSMATMYPAAYGIDAKDWGAGSATTAPATTAPATTAPATMAPPPLAGPSPMTGPSPGAVPPGANVPSVPYTPGYMAAPQPATSPTGAMPSNAAVSPTNPPPGNSIPGYPPGSPGSPSTGYQPPVSAPYSPPYAPVNQASLGLPAGGYPPPPAAAESQLPLPSAQHLEGVQILARVGSEAVLANDVYPYVDDLIRANISQIPPEYIDKQRELLVRQKLKQLIETKSVIADVKRTVPKEGYENIQKKLGEAFEKIEVPKMVKKAKLETRQQLVLMLDAQGTSLEREKRAFMERTLAEQWLRQKVKTDEEITHEQMLTWYRQHSAEFEFPSKARWQQLTMRFGPQRSKGEAYQELARLGNAVLDGAPFAEVAKRHSEGATRQEGGIHDWTTKGSLVSATLDQAVFTLPVGQMSPILEDAQGFHIVVVLERNEAGRVPFTEAQVTIKQKIKQERFSAQVKQLLAEMKDKTPVWTVFDEPSQTDQLTDRPTAAPR